MFRCVDRSGPLHHHSPRQSEAISPEAIFASAAGVVASAEETVLQRGVEIADAAAATAWTSSAVDVDLIFDRERDAQLAREHAADLAVELKRVARRSAIAAELAAEAVTRGLTAREYVTSTLMSDRIRAILAADAVVLP